MSSMETYTSISVPVLWNDLQPDNTLPYPREERARNSFSRVAVLPAEEAEEAAEQILPASAWTLCRARRVLDFCLAAGALTVFAPVFCLIAMVVRLTSPGPVIFRQQRVGRMGELFTIYKFRTMEAGPEESPGLSVTRHGDRRITRAGSLLRRYKLDELPQLVNVLYGDMSLVGPRPKLPDHHQDVMRVPYRPGITGAATLVFRREEEMLRQLPDEKLEAFCVNTLTPYKARLDFNYAEDATLATDLQLLYKTAQVCLCRSKSELPQPASLV
jgi:lipopolysaccharide/colanic/teichoic acid biosynthesis glycosyltransferase